MDWIAEVLGPGDWAPGSWALAGIVTLAFVTEAVLGFGSTVMVVSLGAQLLPLNELLPTYVPLNMVLSAWLVARHHRHVDLSLLLVRILPFMAVGMAAAFLLPFLTGASLDQALLLGLFGIVVMGLALPELLEALRRPTAPLTPSVVRGPLTRPVAALVLGAGGLIHGLFGSGGPMVVYFTGRLRLDKSVFRATLAGLWLLLNGVLVGMFLHRGEISGETLRRSGGLVVPLLIGAVVGEHLHGRVDVRVFRTLVFVLLFLAGLSLALRHLLP